MKIRILLGSGLLLLLLAGCMAPYRAAAEDPRIYMEQRELQRLEARPDGNYGAAGYRSGRGTYSGGARSRAPAPGNRAGTGTVNRTPGGSAGTAPPRAGAGTGFFGGLALGSLLGGIFNPFGFGYGYGGGGVSLWGLMFWGLLAYALFRIIRRSRSRDRR